MKSCLRSSARAAAALFAVAGAFAAAQPAFAQHNAYRYDADEAYGSRSVAPAPRATVERFVMYGSDAYRAGDLLHFRLEGTPGGVVNFEIPTLLGASRLPEIRPGVYEGAYKIRPGTDPAALFRAHATLEVQGQRVAMQVADARGGYRGERGAGWGHRDRTAPEIVSVSPSEGERVGERGWTRITAQVSDRGTGIESVSLRVDGRDVSQRVRFEGDDVRYAEDLQPGRHVAELAVRDRAGNVSRRSWSFDVVEEGRHRGWQQRW